MTPDVEAVTKQMQVEVHFAILSDCCRACADMFAEQARNHYTSQEAMEVCNELLKHILGLSRAWEEHGTPLVEQLNKWQPDTSERRNMELDAMTEGFGAAVKYEDKITRGEAPPIDPMPAPQGPPQTPYDGKGPAPPAVVEPGVPQAHKSTYNPETGETTRADLTRQCNPEAHGDRTGY